MAKQIWLPDSKTHVTVENGNIRIWDTMIMIKQDLNKSNFGFKGEKYPSPSSPEDKERYFKDKN